LPTERDTALLSLLLRPRSPEPVSPAMVAAVMPVPKVSPLVVPTLTVAFCAASSWSRRTVPALWVRVPLNVFALARASTPPPVLAKP